MDELNLSTVDAEPVVNVEPQNIESVNEPVQTNIVETVEPQQETKPQSAEENSKFAQVRREAEQRSYAKAQDDLIARQYGESHGIYTLADYDKAMDAQKQEQELSELLARNISEEDAQELLESRKLKEEIRAEKESKQQQEQQQADLQDFIKEFPDVKPDDIPTEVWQANANGKPLADAYARYALRLTKTADTKAKANEENARASMGDVSGLGGQSSILTEEMIGNMSTQELSSRWGEVKKLFKMK